MAPPQRQTHSALEERLFETFYEFSFFKAVQLLERLHPECKPLGQSLSPAQEALRFAVKPGLEFPAAEITGLEAEEEGQGARMSVSFLGLIGPNGVLPHWYNELALERIRYKDLSLCAFLDIFHHRLISLFYLAWKKNRFPENYQPGGQDRQTRYLLSLCGLGTPGLAGRIGLPPEAMAFYAGLLAMPAPTAAGLEAAVAYLAGVKATCEQFMERIIPLDAQDRTRLGAANASLGVDALCGGYIWDAASKFRLSLGPMSFKEYQRFLPGSTLQKAIFAFVRYMVGIEYEFELKIILDRHEVPPCELGSSSRLGLTAWVLAPHTHPDDDASITIICDHG